MGSKYNRAEEIIESAREERSRVGYPASGQLAALLVIAEMFVDVARTLSELSREGIEVRIDRERY